MSERITEDYSPEAWERETNSVSQTPDYFHLGAEAAAGEMAIPEDLRARYEAAKRTCNINEGQYIERIAKLEAEIEEWKGQCEHTQTLAAEMVLLRAKLTTAREALETIAEAETPSWMRHRARTALASLGKAALAATEEK
jgi:hypothetical protein